MFRLQNTFAVAACVAALASPAAAQTKWNLPAAYPADNPHSVNLIAFAKDVGDATGGKLQITVHAAASLFKAPEQSGKTRGTTPRISLNAASSIESVVPSDHTPVPITNKSRP